jgi:hypothetical protein
MGCRAQSLAGNYFHFAPQGRGQATVLDCWLSPQCDSGRLDEQQPLSASSSVDGKHRPPAEPAQRRD